MSINKAIITGIGILGSVASLYALSQGNGLQQKTQGENSPNINKKRTGKAKLIHAKYIMDLGTSL